MDIGGPVSDLHWSQRVRGVLRIRCIEHTCISTRRYWLSPLLPTSHSHDWHHETTNEYFGTIGLLDSLCGTAKRWFAREKGQLAVHIVGVDDTVAVDTHWEDSDEEAVGQQ